MSQNPVARRDRTLWHRSRGWLLLAGTLVLALGLLYGQPRWTTRHQLLALLPPATSQATPSQQSAQLHTLVQASLRLQPAHAPPPHWHGPGQRTLKHLWPRLQREQRRQQARLLSLQLAQYSPSTWQPAYADFPHQYAITLGQPRQLRVLFQRHHLLGWQATQVCAYAPQPLLDLNRCPSDSR